MPSKNSINNLVGIFTNIKGSSFLGLYPCSVQGVIYHEQHMQNNLFRSSK